MKSYLYNDKDATLEMDERLILHLIFDNVAGGKDAVFQKDCAKKIIQTIHGNKWQKIYKSSHFVHLVDLYGKEKIGDVKFIFMCQLLEILYFYRCNKESAKKLTKISFNTKLETLFLSVYGRPINKKTSNIIRILRNHVAHTGTLEKIKGVFQSRDVNAINSFKKVHKTKSLRPLAFSFNFLMIDIFFRSIGLEDSELFRNGMPPQYLDYFKI